MLCCCGGCHDQAGSFKISCIMIKHSLFFIIIAWLKSLGASLQDSLNFKKGKLAKFLLVGVKTNILQLGISSVHLGRKLAGS